LPEKLKLFENWHGKIEFCLPKSTTPRISNQIDAADLTVYYDASIPVKSRFAEFVSPPLNLTRPFRNDLTISLEGDTEVVTLYNI